MQGNPTILDILKDKTRNFYVHQQSLCTILLVETHFVELPKFSPFLKTRLVRLPLTLMAMFDFNATWDTVFYNFYEMEVYFNTIGVPTKSLALIGPIFKTYRTLYSHWLNGLGSDKCRVWTHFSRRIKIWEAHVPFYIRNWRQGQIYSNFHHIWPPPTLFFNNLKYLHFTTYDVFWVNVCCTTWHFFSNSMKSWINLNCRKEGMTAFVEKRKPNWTDQ